MVLFLFSSILLTGFQESGTAWTEKERNILVVGLRQTGDSLLKEIKNLSEDEWAFQEDENRWSIRYITEHIFLQDQAYYREVKILSFSPPRPELSLLNESDSVFINYATDPNSGIADWDVEPTGRFCTLEDSRNAFIRLRSELQKLLSQTRSDFRRIFTFRTIPESVIKQNPTFYKARLRRDLHQLLLTDIAHTKRHLKQIRKVKSHVNYPGNRNN